jgi:Tfp pilus assembly protein PilN
MLDELATSIPEKLWLESLDEVDGRLTLAGVSINNEVIATFMTRLEESKYFGEVYLVSIERDSAAARSSKEDLKLKKFTITAQLRVPVPGGGT